MADRRTTTVAHRAPSPWVLAPGMLWQSGHTPWTRGVLVLLAATICVPGCGPPERKRSPIYVSAPAPSGSPAWEFGSNGAALVNPSTGPDAVTALLLTGSDIFVGGTDVSPGPGDEQWRIEKRSAGSGLQVSGFGATGVVASNPSSATDRVLALASDGTYLYAAGFDNSSGNRQWRIEKRQVADGLLDTSFGASGVLVTNPSTGPDEAVAIVVGGASMYVIGADEVPGAGDTRWRIEKRQTTDGALITGFGSSGVAISNPSSGADRPAAAAWDGTSLYIGGYDSTSGNRQWRIEKRGGTDGALDSAFGTSGVVLANPSTGTDEITSILLDGSAMIIGGFDESPGVGDTQWRLERRAVGDGALVSAFGSSGVIAINPSTGADEIRDVYRLSSSELVVAGSDATPNPATGDRQWRIEKRALSSGALDSAFGNLGVVTSDPGTFDDVPRAIASTSTTIIVAGTDFGPSDSRWRVQAWYR